MTHGPEYDDNLSRSEVFKLGSILKSLREILKSSSPSHTHTNSTILSLWERAGWGSKSRLLDSVHSSSRGDGFGSLSASSDPPESSWDSSLQPGEGQEWASAQSLQLLLGSNYTTSYSVWSEAGTV